MYDEQAAGGYESPRDRALRIAAERERRPRTRTIKWVLNIMMAGGFGYALALLVWGTSHAWRLEHACPPLCTKIESTTREIEETAKRARERFLQKEPPAAPAPQPKFST